MLRHFVLRTVREKLLCACCLCTKVVPCIPTTRPCPIWPPPQPVPLLPFPLLFLTENTHVPSLCSSSTKPWRRNPSKPTKSTTSSSEFDGRPIKDDADELHHHLDHLFLAEDLGEGHPQASPLSSPSFQVWTRLDLHRRRSTPTSGPSLVLYSSLWAPLTVPFHSCALIQDP